MSDLDRAVSAFRRAALARERHAATALTDAYSAVWGRLRPQLTALTARISEARARGEEPSRAWLARESRYQQLLAQIEAEIRTYAAYAESTVLTERRAAVDAAMAGVDDLLRAAMGTPPPGVSLTFNRLPTLAVEQMVGALADDAPLRALLAQLGPAQAKVVSEALIRAVGLGLGPREIAREVRAQFLDRYGLPRNAGYRALLLSRTEINRAFRSAALESYRANSEVVAGWRWLSARGPRTCGLCFAMDGKVFPLDRPFASHPACRCTPLPVTRDLPGWQSPPSLGSGREAFADLPESDQRTILGPGKYRLYRDGLLDWDALVTETHSRVWGPGRRETSLRELDVALPLAAD